MDGGNSEVVIDVVAKFRDMMSKDVKQGEQTVSKFDATVARAQKDTAKFGSTRARPLIDVNDKATSKIREATSSGQSFARRAFTATLSATDKATKTVDLIRGSCKSFASSIFTATLKVADKVTAPLRSVVNNLLSVKTLIAGLATGAAAKAFIGVPIQLADNLSTASVGFETMLHSASKAQQLMSDIQKFAIKTPFNTQDLVKDSQQMLAYGFNAKQVIPTLNSIGNAEAALGGGAEGIQRTITALGQMRMKGKVSAEEMLQLTENGINGWKYLSKSIGKTVPQTQAMVSKGLIPVDKAIDSIVEGMGEFNGMMDKTANRTASGLLSQIKDTFDVGIISKWGHGLQTGAIKGLTKFNKFLSDIGPTLSKAGTSLEDFGAALSTKVFNVLGNIEDRMTKVFNSDRFKNASIGGKIKIAWDEVIAKPFSDWWDSTGKKKIAKKLSGMGESLGAGITGGITAILGFGSGDARQQGINLGSSFFSGFVKGFDGKKIVSAFQNFAETHKVLMVALGLKLGASFVKGLSNAITTGKTITGALSGIFGKGKSSSGSGGSGMNMPSASTVSSMNVLADVVNLVGKSFAGAPGIPVTGSRASGAPALPSGEKPLLESGEAVAGGSLLQKFGASKAGSLFGKIGTKLGSGAATAGGAALAGSAATAGAITAGVGVANAGKDLYNASKMPAGQAKREKQFQGGTKLGMIGAGAGTGALIGAAIPIPGVGPAVGALVGAGVGGASALIGGNKAGSALAKSTNKGGTLNNAGKAVGGFFTKTVPDTAGKIGTGIGTFVSTKVAPTVSSAGKAIGDVFTNKIPSAFQTVGAGLGTFFTQMVPQAVQTVGSGLGTFFNSTLPNFFTQQLPFAIGYATGKAQIFFTQDIPNFFGNLWNGISTFFTSTLPTWASNVWNNNITPFFTQSIPNFFGTLWNGISTFFTSTLPTWVSNVWNNNISPFFTQSIPTFFGNLWNGISTFFTSTLPTWASNVWNGRIVPFFTQSIPNFFGTLWNGLSTFFTSTLPTWASNVWNNNITPFFTKTIPGFFSSLWGSVNTFFTNTLPELGTTIWNSIKGFFTNTLPNFFKDIWGTITHNFSAGYSAATSGSTQSAHKAAGGLISRPTVTLLGEEGTPEMVIPLSSRRHDRGVQLWRQTGSALGQSIDAKANGGFGGNVIQFPSSPSEADTPHPRPAPAAAGGAGGGKPQVVIQSIKIVVEGGNGDVVQQIKDHKEEIANVVSDAIAEGIEKDHDNTPLEESA